MNCSLTNQVPLEKHLNVTDDELSNVLGGGYAVYGKNDFHHVMI